MLTHTSALLTEKEARNGFLADRVIIDRPQLTMQETPRGLEASHPYLMSELGGSFVPCLACVHNCTG